MKAITILILALIAVVGVFSAPEDSKPMVEWTVTFLTTKAVGVGAAMLSVRLYDRWYGKRFEEGGEA